MAGGQPPHLEWQSGEPDCVASFEAWQERRFHRILAASYRGLAESANQSSPAKLESQKSAISLGIRSLPIGVRITNIAALRIVAEAEIECKGASISVSTRSGGQGRPS
jgi:hypothetical protein